MIITRTPYRISFFGGGTDFKSWYENHGGAVLSVTIDRYCYICFRRMPPFLGTKYRIFWSHAEAVDRISDIRHPAVRGCLEATGLEDGIEINHAGDLPARSGLGSSSAFTVGLLNAIGALRKEYPAPGALATEAIRVEQDILKETVGVQDQIICAHGGFQHIRIEKDGSYALEPMLLSAYARAELPQRLMLFFTGIQRDSSEIQDAQVKAERTDVLRQIAACVPLAIAALKADDLDWFGRLLDRTWCFKRRLSDKVSNPEIDQIYKTAMQFGALGGKVLGAGGGGFMLFYVPLSAQQAVRDALRPLIDVPVRFSHYGSQVILDEGQ